MRRPIFSFLFGLALGAAAVGALGHYWKERQLASLMFIHELQRTGNAVSMLSMAEAHDLEKVQLLAAHQLSTSIESSHSMLSYRPTWSVAIPNLAEGVNRAEKYATANDIGPDLVEKIRDVQDYLQNLESSENGGAV